MSEQPDQPEFPALSDAELRETLDLMATAVASMSDRIDALTVAADKQIKLSTEARIAAFAAKDQTDPKRYGALIGQTVEDQIADSLRSLNQASNDVLSGIQRSNASFQETTTAHSSTLSLMDELRQQQEQDRRWLPWVGLGAVVLTIVLTVTLPRFSAVNSTTCVVFGGEWGRTTQDNPACVHYQE